MATLDEQIACLRREIGLRERVYPRWVDAGKMKPETAAREKATMEAVLNTLEHLRVLSQGGAP